MLVLGNRREAGQHSIQITAKLRNCCTPFYGTGYHRCIQPEIIHHEFAYIVVKIACCICKGCEDNNLLVSFIDRMLQFISDNSEQLLKLGIIFGRNISNHQRQQLENFTVFRKTFSPGLIVHISDFNSDFFAKSEQFVTVLIFTVVIINVGNVCQIKFDRGRLIVSVDAVYR